MKNFILILFFCFTTFQCFALEKCFGKIYFEHDTVSATFFVSILPFSKEINYAYIQEEIKFKDEENKLKKLYPEQAKEYRLYYKQDTIRMISHSFITGRPNVNSISYTLFLKLESKGNLSTYCHYTNNFGGYTPIDNGGVYAGGVSTIGTSNTQFYLFQKGNGKLKKPLKLGFIKDMRQYFSDCESLVQKIEDKTFKRKDLKEIAEYYNNNCN